MKDIDIVKELLNKQNISFIEEERLDTLKYIIVSSKLAIMSTVWFIFDIHGNLKDIQGAND